VAQAVVEADRLDPLVALKRMAEADGRILAARKEHQRSVVVFPLRRLHSIDPHIKISCNTPSAR